MKKFRKLLAVCCLVSLLLPLLCGCAALDEMRASQAFFDEEGNILYERNFSYGRETESFGEGGVLVKYVDNGTVYEGDQIPANAKQNFEELQKMIKETYAERH